MKYASEYRGPGEIFKLINSINNLGAGLGKKVRLMEVCGTHTMAAARMGLSAALDSSIELLSGPGCPVCVSCSSYISKAIVCAQRRDVIIATFGDMMRVPSNGDSLMRRKGLGADVRVVYSPMDALEIARDNKDKKVVFLGVGFETTAPGTAACVEDAARGNVKNFFVLCAHKTMPAALEAIAGDAEANIDGFILPGHVSAVIGSLPYDFLVRVHKIPCVIAGFEPLDIAQAVYMLAEQILRGEPRVRIQYSRAVREQGNPRAVKLLYRVFEPVDCVWRGMGVIPSSGLKLRPKYSDFDAENCLDIDYAGPGDNPGCICGEVLKGKARPGECSLFGKECTPENPAGACMVSGEGACAAVFRYGG